ncbi:hypothetical protein B9P99_02095 [Candidatus Marsarchaeota G1 archaeon OSP_B]|jgi:Nucleotidyltransferase domain.|uniref:Polymerase nucleotidyl transferase domain-containing protein n=3 Tax=Candidatus Marsarchaeota group 1 TaxID=2203770 RepID=A0A2R6A7W3_9ARCH|nr:MAG: hypothetical protein B9Q01_07670 [Candidatus Marsarchaeota G1 archaeon OSP_D]PSN87428.1 MAG: hypothetical protein B9Q00_08900 [Candidatus Marsarchaeota G1 archaeon OSP_C]PSN93843.1 MAG: hypothetical protein B9P99_02095 [Candidatus Marsarchaeota G1 archaeon OSP_B]
MVKAKSAIESQKRMAEVAKQIVEKVSEHFPIIEVRVFGSRARGDYLDTSDLDLIFVFEKLDTPKIELVQKISRFIKGNVDFLVMQKDEAQNSALVKSSKLLWDKQKGFDLTVFEC